MFLKSKVITCVPNYVMFLQLAIMPSFPNYSMSPVMPCPKPCHASPIMPSPPIIPRVFNYAIFSDYVMFSLLWYVPFYTNYHFSLLYLVPPIMLCPQNYDMPLVMHCPQLLHISPICNNMQYAHNYFMSPNHSMSPHYAVSSDMRVFSLGRTCWYV